LLPYEFNSGDSYFSFFKSGDIILNFIGFHSPFADISGWFAACVKQSLRDVFVCHKPLLISFDIRERLLEGKGWRKDKYWGRALKKLMRISTKALFGGGKNK
jgi:hypothetical protein